MRTIKFRAWDTTAKAMILDYKIGFLEGTYSYSINDEFTNEEYVFMQYTGLKDKNGKEIYEGDIVEWKYLQTWHKNEVRWVGGGFVVTTSGFKDDLNEPQDLSLVSILNCEIIGNIYENPELLKK